MSKVSIFSQLQEVMISSAPWFRKTHRGRRLTKNAIFTAVFTLVTAQRGSRGAGVRVVRMGYVSSAKIMIRLDVIIVGMGSIAATWICTKSFWFLRPMDELLSFRSWSREPWSSTKGDGG